MERAEIVDYSLECVLRAAKDYHLSQRLFEFAPTKEVFEALTKASNSLALLYDNNQCLDPVARLILDYWTEIWDLEGKRNSATSKEPTQILIRSSSETRPSSAHGRQKVSALSLVPQSALYVSEISLSLALLSVFIDQRYAHVPQRIP
ncbi:hypothetical protein NMY22_g18028 [Coprinellus aureogranulatus]|nr:hypothetical protein NMY22_g18028 [Coprinellus aureogranulatus]